jgi:hypothetical protein
MVVCNLVNPHIHDSRGLEHPPAIAVVPFGLRFQPGISDLGQESFRKLSQRAGLLRKRIRPFHDLSESQTRYLRRPVSFGFLG